jgi:hypothetical protein
MVFNPISILPTTAGSVIIACKNYILTIDHTNKDPLFQKYFIQPAVDFMYIATNKNRILLRNNKKYFWIADDNSIIYVKTVGKLLAMWRYGNGFMQFLTNGDIWYDIKLNTSEMVIRVNGYFIIFHPCTTQCIISEDGLQMALIKNTRPIVHIEMCNLYVSIIDDQGDKYTYQVSRQTPSTSEGLING